INNSLGKGSWSLLRQIVSDAALDDPVRILVRKFRRVGARVGMRSSVGVTFQRNRRHGDDRAYGESLFQIVVSCLAVCESKPPTVIVDHDGNVIRIVEGRRTAVKRSITELPFRRSGLPNELRKLAPVFLVADSAAFRCEVKLVPPLELSAGRQRYPAGFPAPYQIAAHRDDRLAAFGPQRRDDICRSCSPVKSAYHGSIDLKTIHQGCNVLSNRRGLAVLERFT